tara:strand:- start:52 stop:786 length:735 start_codon:yes stop_codon:yes gene_type:complete
MADQGWISIHRGIQDNWLWKDEREFSRLEAWLDILLNVNHTPKKVLIKNTLIEVGRGESLRSLDTWGKRWNWNKSRVRRFFNLLQKDSMIVTKNVRVTTLLTVCKYDSYQTIGNTNETQVKHKRNASETQMTPNNNVNNDNNENKEIKQKEKASVFNFRKELLSLGGDEQLVSDWLMVRNKKKSANTKTALNGFLKQVKTTGKDLNVVLEKCVVSNWSGFKAEWLNKTDSFGVKKRINTKGIDL